VRRKKSATNTLAALKSIRAARPDGAPIYAANDPHLGSPEQGQTVFHPDLLVLG
jgi:hypothetical protein